MRSGWSSLLGGLAGGITGACLIVFGGNSNGAASARSGEVAAVSGNVTISQT